MENIRLRNGIEPYVPPEGPPRVQTPDAAIYAAMGEEGIIAMMEAFYAELAQSPTLRRMFPQTPDALRRAAHRSAAFFIGICGGPPLYHQLYGNPAMRARHMPFPIDEPARVEWLRCFNVVLDDAPARFAFPAEHLPGFRAFLARFFRVDGEHRPQRMGRASVSGPATTRAWAGPDDLVRLHALLRGRFRLLGPPRLPSRSATLTTGLPTTATLPCRSEIQLWFEGAEVIGYVWPADDEMDYDRAPQRAVPRCPKSLPGPRRACSPTAPASGAIKAWCFGEDAQLAALLSRLRATRAAMNSCAAMRCGNGRAAACRASLPPATRCARCAGPRRRRARAAAHMAAFPDWPMDAASHMRAMQNATYRRELDIVATPPGCAADRRPAAIVWYDPDPAHGALRADWLPPATPAARPRHSVHCGGAAQLNVAGRHVGRGVRLARRFGREPPLGKLGFREVERRYIWERGAAAPAQPTHS